MTLATLRLKKNDERRVRSGHPWIFSNEIDTSASPLKSFTPGQEVIVEAADKTVIGIAYLNPHSLITGRIFSRNSAERLDTDFFIKRLTSALAFRDAFFPKPYYRLIFSEADGLPGVVIDRFANDFVVQINTAGMELKIEMLADALRSVFPDLESILLRNDSSIRHHEQLSTYTKALHGTPPEEVALEENDTYFYAPIERGQKTGWFYDHRLNRARLKDYVVDKEVLDVFSYVGGWAIQAAKYGAKHVDCIEASAFACEYIQKNAERNQVSANINVICDDAFDAMRALVQQGKQYDVIILDPPAFVKKFKDRKEGLIAYQRLNELSIRLLKPNGILFSCSCSMHVSADDLTGLVQRAAHRAQQSTVQILERGHQGPDHPVHTAIPESDYLKVVVVRKLA